MGLLDSQRGESRDRDVNMQRVRDDVSTAGTDCGNELTVNIIENENADILPLDNSLCRPMTVSRNTSY